MAQLADIITIRSNRSRITGQPVFSVAERKTITDKKKKKKHALGPRKRLKKEKKIFLERFLGRFLGRECGFFLFSYFFLSFNKFPPQGEREKILNSFCDYQTSINQGDDANPGQQAGDCL